MNLTLLTSFLAAALVVQLVPGPGMLFILANGMAGGRRAGVAAAFGAATGILLHTVAVAFGLAALVAHAPGLLDVVRLAGAAYLLWLAVGAFRAGAVTAAAHAAGAAPSRGWGGDLRTFLRGVVNSLANPKAVVFFVAFLPQFVDPAAGPVTLQLLTLGVIFLLMGLCLDVVLGLGAGHVGQALRRRPAMVKLANRLAGTIFAGLAARLAVTDHA